MQHWLIKIVMPFAILFSCLGSNMVPVPTLTPAPPPPSSFVMHISSQNDETSVNVNPFIIRHDPRFFRFVTDDTSTIQVYARASQQFEGYEIEDSQIASMDYPDIGSTSCTSYMDAWSMVKICIRNNANEELEVTLSR